MAERLREAQSSYLRQHADNPIDWWPWGDEAFSVAEATNRPILLSVGYASCHWCHVMAHESFENAEVAAFINEHFVPIKVDRQEHPEVDARYMKATQALTGAGGWPMTCFLTPDGYPFFAGTYYPPEPGPGRPSFLQVCQAMAQAWSTRSGEVIESARAIVSRLSEAHEPHEPGLDIDRLVKKAGEDFDLINGGFGDAPKFPPTTLLAALLVRGDKYSLDMAQLSLEAMARGGICDQVGGGFHRYAVDAGWAVPHFEKLLSDNALLLGCYVRGWRRTPDHEDARRALFERTVYGIIDWLVRELRAEGGAFMAGLDADSCDIRGAVHEGIFYLWNQELLLDALGEDDANWACHTFHVTKSGTFDDGLSTLQLRGTPDYAKLDEITGRLLAERENRFRPGVDELIIASWNGWLIDSLLNAGMIFNEPDWIVLAEDAAEYLWRVHWDGQRLSRTSYAGQPGVPGIAEDYGALGYAFAALAGVTGNGEWLSRAEQLCEIAIEAFPAPDGGFSESPAGRFQPESTLTEAATPSGTSCLIGALNRVGLMARRPDFLERADRALKTTFPAVMAAPRFAGAAFALAQVSAEASRGLPPATVVIVTGDRMGEQVRAAWRLAPAGTAIMAGPAGTTGFADHFDGRDEPGVYICRGEVCFGPVADYSQLKEPLWQRI